MADSIMLLSKVEVLYLMHLAFDVLLDEGLFKDMSKEFLRRCTKQDLKTFNGRIITPYGERVLKANFKRLMS